MRLRCKSRLTRKKDRIGAQPNHCSINALFVPFVRDTTRLFLCFENRSRLCATASKYQSMANNKCNKRRNSLESESFFLPDSSSRRRRRKNDEGWKRRKIEEDKIDTKWNICNKVLISIYTKYLFLFEF